MRRGWALPFAVAAAATAHAEVPGHNPNLDSQCSPGYQWSRETVACEQTTCPPGAGRTYTLECNCGEAWGNPFVTCRDDKTGLATHCVPVPMKCDERKNGFDPITGACKPGFVDDGKGGCNATFPERQKCRLEKLGGQPIAGTEVTFAEAAPPGAGQQWTGEQHAPTGTDGTVEFPVANRQAEALLVSVRNAAGRTIHKVRLDLHAQPGECVLKVYDAGEAERHVKDEYADLLGRACVSADEIARLRAIQMDPATTGKPRFDPEANTVQGTIEGPWDETGATLFHELGHAISDQILDPTWGFVKGVPLVGKFAGGSHDPWTANQYKDEWGPDVDPEELAFEEGLADFMAVLQYARRGQVYDPELLGVERAEQAINGAGAGSASRIEGVVTSFLYQYYKPLIESGPDGPAQALGDFIRVLRYDPRTARIHGTPARTLPQFIAAAARAAGEQHPCKAAQTAPLGDLANRYGLGAAPPATVHLRPVKPGATSEVEQAIHRMGLDAARALAERQAAALDLLAEEQRLAHDALGRITGAFSADDLLGEIFGRFC
ncbi:MAG TPA: hypothetical protein VL172_19470, partial [Kofleriaceae bacterium]|nr:hypothetical protein [Kofleriaceae bacterium]